MTHEEIGAFIRQRRETLLLNQEDLSEMAGITSKTIYAVEKGKGNPSLHTLQKLLSILGLEIHILIKRIEE